jgi:hypothetical protein
MLNISRHILLSPLANNIQETRECTELLSYTTPLAYTVANTHRVLAGKTVMTDDRKDRNDGG